MKNAFKFMLRAFFVLKLFKLLSRRFGHARKRLDKKAKFNGDVMMSWWWTDVAH